MHKKILFLLLTFVLMLSFVACGGSKNADGARDTVVAFSDALASLDADAAKKCLKDGQTELLNPELDFNRANMIAEYEQVGIDQKEATAITEKIIEVNKQLVSYKVMDTETDGKKATVTVVFSVKDPTDCWDKILTSEEILLAYGSESQGAVVLKSYELLEKELETVSANSVNVKFSLENIDGKWLISDMEDKILEVY
ncbi:MAG: hypothetical protein IJE10_10110 [Clostridia bacterium]|nr:hypothetical protein [Clostridia bacterium]